MPATETVDAVIIGTGQAGKPLATSLSDAGWRTVIIEKGRVGGTCVVTGCTPTKTMAASARVAHLVRRAGDYGVRTGPVSMEMQVVRDRKRRIVDDWSRGAEEGLTGRESLELVRGVASFAEAHVVEVFPDDDRADPPTRRFQAEHVFVNSGGRPRIPDLAGLDQVPYLTSTSIMELETVPQHLVVLGGGFIGLEFAQMFRRFGADVSIVEASPRLASSEDEDVAEALAGILEEDGISVHTDTEAVEVRDGPHGIRVTLRAGGGDRWTLDGSHLLVAVGRVPNTESLQAGKVGLHVDHRGYLPVDERCRTDVDGVWGLGDVTGAPPFTHVAYDDFRVVRSQLLGSGSHTRKGRIATYTLFTDPELGRVGLTEQEAREAGYDVRVAKLPMAKVARAMETDEMRGLMKAVIDAENDTILGAAVLGVHGGEVAAVLTAAMMGGLTCAALRDGIFSHPTLAEALNNLFATAR